VFLPDCSIAEPEKSYDWVFQADWVIQCFRLAHPQRNLAEFSPVIESQDGSNKSPNL
jgi:hypothetical protein